MEQLIDITNVPSPLGDETVSLYASQTPDGICFRVARKVHGVVFPAEFVNFCPGRAAEYWHRRAGVEIGVGELCRVVDGMLGRVA